MRRMMLLALVTSGFVSLQSVQAADATKGAVVYKKCALCHAIEAGKKHGVGPNLHGVVGRKAAVAANYRYSSALAASGLIWTPDKLDAYITKPSALVKGTKMAYSGISNAQDRANLIAYLKLKK
jgi:cytochrome c